MKQTAREIPTECIDNPQHHAYVVFSTVPDTVRTDKKNSLYVIRSERGISIEDVRLLGDYASQSTSGTRRVVVEAPAISFQAQNALLKLLEETQKDIHFYFFIPLGTRVLETLLSRCYVLEDIRTEECPSEHFQEFITAGLKDRLVMIDEIWSQGESVRHTAILRLVQDFEIYAHQRIHAGSEKHDEHMFRCLRSIRSLRGALESGALHKGTLQLFAFA